MRRLQKLFLKVSKWWTVPLSQSMQSSVPPALIPPSDPHFLSEGSNRISGTCGETSRRHTSQWLPQVYQITSVRHPNLRMLHTCPVAAHRLTFFPSPVISGPNFPLANGCLVPCLETNIRYAFSAAKKIQYDGIKSLAPSQRSIDDFQEYKDSLMEDLVWTGSCASW